MFKLIKGKKVLIKGACVVFVDRMIPFFGILWFCGVVVQSRKETLLDSCPPDTDLLIFFHEFMNSRRASNFNAWAFFGRHTEDWGVLVKKKIFKSCKIINHCSLVRGVRENKVSSWFNL